MKKKHFFHEELREGIFLISCKEWEMGKATINTYLIVGREKAVLVDAGLGASELKEYAQQLAGVPVMLVLSHGHFDHTGAVNEFEDVWIHPEDALILGKNIIKFLPSRKITAKIHYLMEGDELSLGDRTLQVYNIKGHTAGSIVLYDQKTKTLISGDSVCRRVFYIDGNKYPINRFFHDLMKVDQLDFTGVCSAHDRFLLPKSQIRHMIDVISDGIYHSNITIHILGRKYFQVKHGSGPEDPKFIDFSAPIVSREQLKLEVDDFFKKSGYQPIPEGASHE
jgi:glyoxylase-like metal-dependent hydrolase (beta-lactamase superfamily II)